MFEELIGTILKTALENPDIKERIKGKIKKAKESENQVKTKEKIIDLDENSYRVTEEDDKAK